VLVQSYVYCPVTRLANDSN